MAQQIVSRRAKTQVGGRLKDTAAGPEWCDFIQESEGAAGGQEHRQEGRVWAGWEAASAGLVCWPDDSGDEPATGRKGVRLWLAPGFHWLCCSS